MDVAETQADLLLNAICANRLIGNNEGECWSQDAGTVKSRWRTGGSIIVIAVLVGVVAVMLRKTKSKSNLAKLLFANFLFGFVKLTLALPLLTVYQSLFYPRPNYSAFGTDNRGNRYELVSQS